MFKVKWKGFGLKYATWEPFSNLNKVLQAEILEQKVKMLNKHLSRINMYGNTPEVKEYLQKWGLKD